MRESERRIKEYKKILPHIQMKVASIAVMLIISIVMMTAATFAWLTVSRSPEVSGIQTTVSANGNLEIALSNPQGTQPLESAIGDAKKEILERNLTWGNLINLSDESYGLEHLELRPAALNVSNLLESPLYAAAYGSDGRVDNLTSQFAYTNYDPTAGSGMFIVPGTTQYGVRAISSVTYTIIGGQEMYISRLTNAEDSLALAQSQYSLLTSVNNEKKYMSTITAIMGDYLTERFNNGTVKDYKSYIPALWEMMKDFGDCLDTTGEAITSIANLQYYLTKGKEAVENPYTLDTLLAAPSSELTANGINIDGLETYKTDVKNFDIYFARMGELKADAEKMISVYWQDDVEGNIDLVNIVNFMVDINSVRIISDDLNVTVGNIQPSQATGLLGSSGNFAVIQKGALFNAEQRLGSYMYAENLEVTVHYLIDVSVSATVYTAANTIYDTSQVAKVPNALNNVGTPDGFEGGDAVAADTYGMAIDVWVRSNADNDFLILEGNTLTEEIQKTDEDGNKYFTMENGSVVIQKAEVNTAGEEVINYYTEDGDAVTISEDEKLSILYETVVIGYEGENRVWNSDVDKEELSEFSTTQGAGSCYIFYADSPQAQAQSLEVLDSMTIAFIDDVGKLLAYADLDVASYYADAGRVTVPLIVRPTSTSVGIDENGNPIYAITNLEKGVAKRITAIIYVDGTTLENGEVLADGNIQGQLNIQFGSSATMEPIVDENIYYDEVHVTGSASPSSLDYTTIESTDDLMSTVKLNITGMDLTDTSEVTANFIRKINDTQGTQQPEISFTSKEKDYVNYSADVYFESPGDYVLRSVWIDGVEYVLDQPIEVSISGFALGSLGWDYGNNFKEILSADAYETTSVWLTFDGKSYVPSKVQGIFANENNQSVTVNFKKGTDNWTGTAKFSASGVYTLQYLLVDGEYYEIPETMQKTVDLTLGMQASVLIPDDADKSWIYDGTTNTVEFYVEIMNNAGEELTDLEGVSIVYYSQGSMLIENGLSSLLTWDENVGRYKGNFSVKNAGVYEFGYITIDKSSIDSASAPTISAIPPVPPSYFKNLTETTIFAYGSDVEMSVVLANSKAIANGNVLATLQKLDENGTVEAEVIVPGTKAKEYEPVDGEVIEYGYEWVFTIPSNLTVTNDAGEEITISQLGTWQITELNIIGAYVDGALSTADNPLNMDIDDIQTKIHDEMTVVVSYVGEESNIELASKEFGNPTAATSGLLVKVRSAGGEFVSGVEDIIVTYTLDTAATGFYSTGTTSVGYDKTASTSAISSYEKVTASLTVDPSDSTQYILTDENTMALVLAGTYEFSSISFKLGNKTYTANTEGTGSVKLAEGYTAPTYTYEWSAPEVQVIGVDPGVNTDITINAGSGGSAKKDTARNSFTTYTATVYHQASFDGGCDGKSFDGYDGYSSVTTKIFDGGTFNTATMVVKSKVEGTDDVEFEYFSSTPSSKKTIGGSWSIDRYALGSGASGTHIVVNGMVGNGGTITYVFELNRPIIINNTK